MSDAIGLEIERRDRVDTDDDMLETTEHPRVFYDSLKEAYEVDLGDSCLCEVYGKNRRAKAMMIATLQARNEALTNELTAAGDALLDAEKLEYAMQAHIEALKAENRMLREGAQDDVCPHGLVDMCAECIMEGE